MTDKLFAKIERRVDEIYMVAPTDLGFPMLTRLYKLTTGPLKTFPLRFIIPASIILGIAVYLSLGLLLTRLASLLQFGF